MKVAIIGCGHIAHKHAEAIRLTEGMTLCAVCDTNRITVEAFALQYGADAYTDAETMLGRKDIELVCICTPSGLHAGLAVMAAEAGKHLVVEKPIALTLADADAIALACRRHGVKCAVVHPNRFRPAIVQLRRALAEGRFGKLSHISANVRWNRNQAYYDQAFWRGTKAYDGGVLMNQAIHQLDLMLWLMGPVASVKAMTATRLRKMECEDVGIAVVEFAGGALGVIEAAATVYPRNYEESLAVFGERGTAVIGGATANWIRHWSFEDMEPEAAQRFLQETNRDPFGVPGHQCIIADMRDAVREDREPAVTAEDGRRALKLVLDICRGAGDEAEAEAASAAAPGSDNRWEETAI
ncbi:Gfo/Idh/MocA family protein [Paenibacillus cymbidii]|uniref:Gfo/Idh/MocA family protein n=1 Tax=Paenibacillus cymbidii TaxID=1639034 RepID=UPI0010817C72|nr:Gfo/Idh/MocA family oxidoreductase [Paenibacillus cymbidii]